MALTALNFTIEQSEDCDTLTFDDVTGTGLTGAYGFSTNIDDTDVVATSFYTTFPDATSSYLNVTYTPPAPSTFGTAIASWVDGVYIMIYTVYKATSFTGTSIALVSGTEYIAYGGYIQETLSGGTPTTIDPSGTTNGVFTAQSGASYSTALGGSIGIKEASVTNNFILFCKSRECIRNLILDRLGEKCDCNEEFDRAVNQLYIDVNGAILAFQYGNHTCANEVLIRISANCSDVCEDCGC